MDTSKEPNGSSGDRKPQKSPPSFGGFSSEATELVKEGYAFEGAAIVALVDSEGGEEGEALNDKNGSSGGGMKGKAMEIVLEDGVMLTVELDSGEKRLKELGYQQDLQRSLNPLELLSIGFSASGIFVGTVPYYSLAYGNAGPVGVVWLWFVTAFFAHILFASLAEISSSFPTAGSLYFWAAALSTREHRAFAAWITGWMEFVGISIGAGALALAGMEVIQYCVLVWTGGSHFFSNGELFGYSALMLVFCAFLNLLPARDLGRILTFSFIFQTVLAVALCITLPIVAPTTQPASFVFSNFDRSYSGSPLPTSAYSVIVALLMSQYQLYSFDSPAHIAEEAKRSDVTTPIAIIGSCSIVSVLGWGVLVALTFSIQNPNSILSSDSLTRGEQPVVQILYDAFYGRYGSAGGAYAFCILIWFSFFFNSTTLIMCSARTGYALARDRGIPGASLWGKVTATKVPVNATVLSTAVSIIFLLPLLAGSAAYFAVAGAATVGWFGAYGVPIYLRLLKSEDSFKPGPFYLPMYLGATGGKLVHLLALLYVLYTMVVFLIPTSYPVTSSSFNYSPIVFAGLLAVIIPWWLIDARRWFQGPAIHDGPQ